MEVNVKKSNNIISKVYKDSIADEIGIEVGDLLISINDQEIHDIIEYKFLMSDEYIELEIQKTNGQIYVYEIEKEYDDDLGIEFTNPIIDNGLYNLPSNGAPIIPITIKGIIDDAVIVNILMKLIVFFIIKDAR